MTSLEPNNLFNVSGIVVVITGGGTGLGLMMAKALENNGAIVYIIGRRFEVLEAAAKQHSKHGNIIPIKGDVTSKDSLQDIAKRVEKERGYVNLLVNNAGVMNSMQHPKEGDSIKEAQRKLWEHEEFENTFKVNVTASYYTTVAFLHLLDAANQRRTSPDQPSSQVIIISSVAAFRRDEKVVSLSYASSKAASALIGKTLANVLIPWNIRSNVIAPGLFPSEMTGIAEDNQETVAKTSVPAGRYGRKEDIGGLILFLASSAGSYVNGGVHLIDGGRLGLFSSTF